MNEGDREGDRERVEMKEEEERSSIGGKGENEG